MLPTSSRRRSLAATSNPSRSSPSALARHEHCSRESTPPSCETKTVSRADRQAPERRGATSDQSSEGKLSSSAGVNLRATTASSAKKVDRGRTNEVQGAAASRLILESTNNTRWRACQFSANQAGRASELVGDSIHANAQRVTVRIFLAAIIGHGPHSRDPDCYFGQALTPGPAETVGANHRDSDF